MTTRCFFCSTPYQTKSGRSVCPNCQRAQVHTSMSNFVLPVTPAGRAAFFVVALLVLMIAVGWAIRLGG